MRKHKSSSILAQVNKDHSVESVMNKPKPPSEAAEWMRPHRSALSAVETSALTDTPAIFSDLTLLSRRSTSIHWTGVDYCW